MDLVFTTAHDLFDKASNFSSSVYNIPAGIDSAKFPPRDTPGRPKDINNIAHPIIAYVGAISDVFDKELIISLANSLPYVNIVLVGPIYTNISALKDIGNIIILGDRKHDAFLF